MHAATRPAGPANPAVAHVSVATSFENCRRPTPTLTGLRHWALLLPPPPLFTPAAQQPVARSPGPRFQARQPGRVGGPVLEQAPGQVLADDLGLHVCVCRPARLVWMLRVTGHPAALLAGGLASYDGPLETQTPSRLSTHFTAAPWPPQHLADIDDATNPNNLVLDARPHERFRGEQDLVDPRPGHVPGARTLPCRENLDSTGRLLPVAQLRQRFGPSACATPAVSSPTAAPV